MKAKLFALCLIVILGACNSEKDLVDIDQPEYNLDDIQVTLDKTTVIENEELTFNIKGRGDFLTFYSGEEGSSYPANASGGIKHTGKIDYYTYAFKEAGTYNVHLVFATKAGKERVFGPYEITVDVDPNKPKPLVEKTIVIGLGPASPTVGESHLIDLAEIKGYSRAEVTTSELKKQIDLLAVWNRPAVNPTHWGEPVFFVVNQTTTTGASSANYYGLAIVSEVFAWDIADKNIGQLIRLSHDPSADELAKFDELKTINQLSDHYTELQTSILTRNTPPYVYNVNWNGPGSLVNMADVRATPLNDAAKLQRLKDHVCIIYFKSASRDLYAAIKMTIAYFPTTFGNPIAGQETTTGINAELRLEVKSYLAPPTP